ncbi:unnamed protein product [Allacma fusca]|uniref:ascorbate ferrireductase (transmembrane) n=1 Tax=Allacma fusca TaxID=39272 RepID=A0A8J2PG08_9HEXA|nr:unnamed protein product [Allacma fusca]
MANNTLSSRDYEADTRRVYVGCGEESNCIGVSTDTKCIERKMCDYLLAYIIDPVNASIEFTLIAQDFPGVNQYVAVGFGDYEQMINNSVVGCIRYKNRLNIYLSVNDDSLQNSEKVEQAPLTPIKISMDLTGSKLFCTFRLKMVFNVHGIPFNLNSNPYYILFAAGPTESSKKIRYHKPGGSTISRSSINLMTNGDQNIIRPRNKSFDEIRVHTCFFCFVFIFLVPTSGMFARFFKESYIERRICNKRLWFTIHWLASLTSVVLIVGAYLVVLNLNKVQTRTTRSEFHFEFGRVVVFLIFVVATLGLLIGCVSPISCLRRLFSLLHCFLGNIVYLLGLIQIFLSVWSKPYYMKFCSSSEATVLAWLLFHFIMYAVLTGMLYHRDRIDARVQQLQALQGMITAAKNYSMQKLQLPDFAYASTGLNRRYSAALPKVSSSDIEKSVEEIERTAKIIDSINYNKRIIEKLYRLNRNVKSKKRIEVSVQKPKVGGPMQTDHNNSNNLNTDKLDPKNNKNLNSKFNGPAPDNNKGSPLHKDRGQKDLKGVSSVKIQVQVPKQFVHNAKKLNKRKPTGPKMNQKKANATKRRTSNAAQTTHAPNAKPDVPKNSLISEEVIGSDDTQSDNSGESEFHNTARRLTIEYVEGNIDGRRLSSFRRRKKSSFNSEDPEDFLNYFHSQPHDLDPYRALTQYPLQPQFVEYSHTTAVTFLLVLFTFVSFGTAVLISYLTYADQYNPGCFIGNEILIFQQWW